MHYPHLQLAYLHYLPVGIPISPSKTGQINRSVISVITVILVDSAIRALLRSSPVSEAGSAQAAGISREAAVVSLKHTHGGVNRALFNELAAWRINNVLLDELVWEYSAYR